jgi:hypothetical protein
LAALYELAVALGWIDMPRDPGNDPAGQRVVEAVTALAVLGTVAAAFRAPGRAFALVPLAAAAWMVAHYYAFDPYYLPARRRFSDAGLVAPSLVYGLALVGVAVAAACRRGERLVPVFVVLTAVVVLVMGAGH